MNTIIETRTFTRRVVEIWNEDEYEDFKEFIAINPEAGQVIPGTGGVRKIRWKGKGIGKQGGARVIYYNKARSETWLLTLYAKSNQEDVSVNELKRMREAIYE